MPDSFLLGSEFHHETSEQFNRVIRILSIVSSTLNEEKNIKRLNSTSMYNNIGQTPLARLRPEKFDDTALKNQIAIIQGVCGDIDPDVIALVFHECDYNVQSTIARIKAGNFEDGGWQTAKSNNKKKNQNNYPTDQSSNGGAQSDSERSLSQRTSPTPSLRGGATGERQRKDYHQSSVRMNTNRRGNDANRYSYNPRYPPRHYPNHQLKPSSTQANSNELLSSSKTNEEITPTTSSSTDEYEFVAGTSQSLTFDNSLKKNSISPFAKGPTSSTIPQEPVSMHPIVQFSTDPIDVQFGDVQWNDSIPIVIPRSNSPLLTEVLDEQLTDVPDNSSTNLMDRELSEITNQLSSSSFEIPTNLLTNQSTEETSHLSDRLNDSSQEQQQTLSASNPSPTSELTNQLLLNSTNPPGTNSSAFTPYTTPEGNFPSIPREYSQNWNQSQPSAKPSMIQSTTYSPQASYPIPPQAQFIVGTYPTQTIYPVITPVDSWYSNGFDPYSTYPSPNYLSTYPTQQHYQSNLKHDPYYDKDFFANYGQNRLPNPELANSSQSTKDMSASSKLSATAASFPHGTSPTGTLYINPLLYAVPTYYPPYQDRPMTYPSLDNRNGASFGGSNTNRNHHHHQQQRTHNNSTWHSQQ